LSFSSPLGILDDAANVQLLHEAFHLMITKPLRYLANDHMPILYIIILFMTAPFLANAEDWTTTDGNTYSDVTVRSVDGDTVTISDQNGNDTISFSSLPPKFQKKARYFAAKANGTAGPAYFLIAQADKAEALARQLHFPVAWLSSHSSYLDPNYTTVEGDAEATRMALATLQGQAIVIFVNGNDDMGRVPPNVHHEGFSQKDDGPLPDGASYNVPKIIFSSPDVKQLWGRVSSTQIKGKGKEAILSAVDAIDNDPAAQAVLAGGASNAAAGTRSAPSPSPSAPPTQAPAPDTSKVLPDEQ
jgi:hypothetical protein